MMVRRLAGLVGLIAFFALVPGAVQAHAVLLETTPQDATRLEQAPVDVRLRFNEIVRPVAVGVTGTGGHPLDANVAILGTTVVVTPQAPLPRGGYRLVYHVVSGDGHPVSGFVSFGVGAPPPPEDAAAESGLDGLTLVAIGARTLHYGGLLTSAGGALFLVLVGGLERALVWRLGGGILIGGLVALIGTGLEASALGASALGRSLSGVLDAAAWTNGVAGGGGLSAMLELAAEVAIFLGLVIGYRTRWQRAAAATLLIGAVVASASLAVTGHAARAAPLGVCGIAVGVHVFCASFWVGSLWPLMVVVRAQPPDRALWMVRRFSSWALVLVLVLGVSGATLSVVQLVDAGAVVHSAYGLLWLSKISVVVGVLGLALINRQVITPALQRGAATAPRNLLRSLRAERALVGVIVLVTAALGAVTPPRALALVHGITADVEPEAASTVAFAALVTGAGGSAEIEVSPALVGPNDVTIRVPGSDGVARVRLTFAGLPTIDRDLSLVGIGTFRASGLEIPQAGRWMMDVEVWDNARGAPNPRPKRFQLEVPIHPVR